MSRDTYCRVLRLQGWSLVYSTMLGAVLIFHTAPDLVVR